ncbi:hypothetical protein CXL00_08850 [Stutzerimonas stutzeri]|uniref:Uncharacterized protein n=1 Tax=Stutzerimonas stutzeri TaxID=316 RepID=A0A2N8STW9_STUST|nr:hypothetical protein CXL00_08850 [Stutzerimonas stutzeri]
MCGFAAMAVIQTDDKPPVKMVLRDQDTAVDGTAATRATIALLKKLKIAQPKLRNRWDAQARLMRLL